MKRLNSRLDLAETYCDELTEASVRLANLVAEHSETNYSHDDSVYNLEKINYSDMQVEERLVEPSTQESYFNSADSPDLLEHISTLISNTNEALAHSSTTHPEEYFDSEIQYRYRSLDESLEQVHEFLEETTVIEEAMNIIQSNPADYQNQEYDRLEFEVPKKEEFAPVKQEKQKKSA